MSLNYAGVERREQILDWQQMYQLSLPLQEELTLHNQPPYTAQHQQQNPDYTYGRPTYQTADHFWQQRNPSPDTQPWQQPPDPPDWQHNSQPQPYGYHDFGTTDLVVPGHTVTAVFRAETYTVPVTMEPPRTSLTDHQTSEGLQLNSTAAKLEHILARFARLEARLVEHERRVAATLPPLQPECSTCPRLDTNLMVSGEHLSFIMIGSRFLDLRDQPYLIRYCVPYSNRPLPPQVFSITSHTKFRCRTPLHPTLCNRS